jgi:hypothetical protein
MNGDEFLPHYLAHKILESGTKILGPVEIEYGFGWDPTITYWLGERRINFYYDILMKGDQGEVAEVADRTIDRVKRIRYNDSEAAWEIMRLFLIEQVDFDQLPGTVWVEDDLDHDKFIPHPPDKNNPANIVTFIDGMIESGATRWEPTEPKSDPSKDESDQ